MPVPNLGPESTVSTAVLTATGSTNDVVSALPFGIYTGSADFISGATDQVAYVYKKLGGDVLDIEIKAANVYAAYEEAVLEYSYIINSHQAKNVLSDMLGASTGTFDEDGQLISGSDASRDFPNFGFSYARRVAEGISTEAGVGGFLTEYSASITLVGNQQKYDLQGAVQTASLVASSNFAGKVENKKVLIRRVYYKSPNATWRFFGRYGGLNAVGNLSTYGQYADDSTFEVVPVWQNKLQAMNYEDNINTRYSHYSYELVNNYLKLYPPPTSGSIASSFDKVWFSFTVDEDANVVDNTRLRGVEGVNNANTLPFENLPYANINSMGKQWIRRFGLALCKEILGQIRSKFATIPIPNDSVTLNGPTLVTNSREEQDKLREELKTWLDELTYEKLAESDAAIVENVGTLFSNVPLPIYVG
jgi:hypothetical protein